MDEPQATQPTNDDFQALHEFFSARRGDGEFFRRLHKLCDRLRNLHELERGADEAQGRLEMLRGRVREAEATLQELHGQVGGARNAAAVKKTIGEAEAEARTIVDRAKQEAAAILEAAGREARQRETHLTARIAAKQAEHDTLHKGIGEAKAAVKGSIPASERLRR